MLASRPRIWRVIPSRRTIRSASTGSVLNPNYSPDGTKIAYIGGEDVKIIDSDGIEDPINFTNQNIYDGFGAGTTGVLYPNHPLQQQIFDNDIQNLSSQYNAVFNHKFKKEGEKLDIEADF